MLVGYQITLCLPAVHLVGHTWRLLGQEVACSDSTEHGGVGMGQWGLVEKMCLRHREAYG
jgi:hypothetical protein